MSVIHLRERDKIRRRNRATIRAEIENYHKTKEYLSLYDEQKEVTIRALNYSIDRVQCVPELSHPEYMTERRLHDVMQESRRRVEAIEWMLGQIKRMPNAEEMLRFIEDKYWRQAYTITSLAEKYHVSEPTIKRWDRQIVKLVALHLGWDV